MREPHLLQVFLSRNAHGVFEVAIEHETGKLVCTCPGYGSRRTCKHIRFVTARLGENGEYTVAVPDEAVAALQVAGQTPASWRAFIHRYTTPEVI